MPVPTCLHIPVLHFNSFDKLVSDEELETNTQREGLYLPCSLKLVALSTKRLPWGILTIDRFSYTVSPHAKTQQQLPESPSTVFQTMGTPEAQSLNLKAASTEESNNQSLIPEPTFQGTLYPDVGSLFLTSPLPKRGMLLFLQSLRAAFVELRALFQLIGETRPRVFDGRPHLLSGQVVHLSFLSILSGATGCLFKGFRRVRIGATGVEEGYGRYLLAFLQTKQTVSCTMGRIVSQIFLFLETPTVVSPKGAALLGLHGMCNLLGAHVALGISGAGFPENVQSDLRHRRPHRVQFYKRGSTFQKAFESTPRAQALSKPSPRAGRG